jgi:histidinol-phosphate phosphatase family protein
MVIEAEHGLIDSPLNPQQVEVYPWVPQALRRLNDAGFGLAIVTNQPAASKGKTSKSLLKETHTKIVQNICSDGAVILSSHICFHRREDSCDCRKPKTGLLEDAFKKNPQFLRENSWMVGDGVTDIQAGASLKLKTAFLGPKKCDYCKIFENHEVEPTFWGDNLDDFSKFILSKGQNGKL